MAPHSSDYFPPPITYHPITSPEMPKQTFILLHGRGSSASKFAPALLSTPFQSPPTHTPLAAPSDPVSSQPPQPALERPDPEAQSQPQPQISSPLTLKTAFPTAKLLFPCAPRQRATIYKRSRINQWFDSWHMDLNLDVNVDNNNNEDLSSHQRLHHHQQQQQQQQRWWRQFEGEEWRAVDGLHATVAHLHELIRKEAALVGGPGNIFLGGISQGCAAGLVALLLWDGERLGGYLGMCGWLPFERAMSSIVSDNGKQQKRELSSADDYWEKGFDPFERDGNVENEEPADGAARAVKVLIEKLELDLKPPPSRPRSFDTPIFLGHGDQDENVAMARGKEAAECLRALGFDVSWSEYQGLGHWYSAEMLTDMTIFLRARAGCEKENETFVTGITA